MALYIPTFPDIPNYVISANLDGTLYQLQFRLSEREACWYLDLSLNDGTPLVGGKKVVCNVSLFRRHRYNPLLPQGHIAVYPSAGQSDEPPNLGELGTGRRCSMFYLSQAEAGP